MGLSPRVRGNPPQAPNHAWLPGSIPACAGEPTILYSIVGVSWVYPRVCGGTSTTWGAFGPGRGLSPRVRGNRDRRAHGVEHRGSIPACAGEPSAKTTTAAGRWVYPRVCGGTQLRAFDVRRQKGLSPRVRGNRPGPVRYGVDYGSIPACAGEPARLPRSAWRCRVYPRVCGGTKYKVGEVHKLKGLSPRVRGNHRVPPAVRPVRGSIPACAGEPPKWTPRTPYGRVYPRVCGGTSGITVASLPLGGLSPRVRGNLLLTSP